MKKHILLIFVLSFFLVSCASKKDISLATASEPEKAIGIFVDKNIKTKNIIPKLEGLSLPKKESYILVDVLYATNRNKTIKNSPNEYFGSDLGELKYGMCQVNIPKSHKIGEIERPSWLRLEFTEDPNKHIVIKSLEELDKQNFFSLMKNKLSKSSTEDILIFIHGYNVAFDDAVRRTAQISYDLNFPGVAMTYSWPSKGTLGIDSYKKDEINAKQSVLFLANFLEDITKNTNNHKIHIIAHSMGNRVLTNAIANVSKKTNYLFNEVILAAPDINSKVFINEILPKIKNKAQRFTLYSSSDDKALKASRIIHKEYRLGESGKYLVVANGIDTIDSSGIDTSLLGHSYYANTKEVLKDIRKVVIEDLSPNQRDLKKKIKKGFSYWKIRKEKSENNKNR